jgi:hypothetical protein
MRPPCASLRGQGPVKAASRTADRRLGLADGPAPAPAGRARGGHRFAG